MELKVNNMVKYEHGKPTNPQEIILLDGMIKRLNAIDTAILESIKRSGVMINFIDDYVGNIIPGLAPPRGYSIGSSWKSVPGMYSSSRNEVLARIGYTNTDCGTFSLELHETGHAVDYRALTNSNFTNEDIKFFENIDVGTSSVNLKMIKAKKITETKVFKDIFASEKNILIPNSAQNSKYFDNIEEYFAETFAMFHSDNSRNVVCDTEGITRTILNCNLGRISPKDYLRQHAPMTYNFFEELHNHLHK